MSADVIPLTDPSSVVEELRDLIRRIESGEVNGLALVAIYADTGYFEPVWYGTRDLGMHGGSILRAAVCWLAAEMDATARAG